MSARTRITRAAQKSTIRIRTAETTRSSRGKRMVVIRLADAMMLSVAVESAAAKNSQGNRPTQRKRMKGDHWLVVWKTLEKMKVSVSIWLMGLTKSQV